MVDEKAKRVIAAAVSERFDCTIIIEPLKTSERGVVWEKQSQVIPLDDSIAALLSCMPS